MSATRVYDAFGMLVSTTGTPKGVFGYVGAQGYVEDPDSGLKLLGHRYYDPSTGRFLTRDSAKDGRNWYDYVDNNPLAGVDPTGLFDWDWSQYWHDALEVLKGEGEAILGTVTAPIQIGSGFVGGGYRHPLTFAKEVVVGSALGIWDDLRGAADGDPRAAGHVTGMVMVAVATVGNDLAADGIRVRVWRYPGSGGGGVLVFRGKAVPANRVFACDVNPWHVKAPGGGKVTAPSYKWPHLHFGPRDGGHWPWK